MKFTDKQKKAIKKAIHWYYLDSYNKLQLTIGGVAGSGKSTIVKYIIDLLELQHDQVIFVCYTAKAALRLRMLGNNANTIHSTFYKVYKDARGRVQFYKRKKLEEKINLIILDEASMSGLNMTNDILSFGIPTIMLGDPKQLPAIMSKPNHYMFEENLDIFLDQAMRFDDNSGILTLAEMTRNGQHLEYGQYKASSVVRLSEIYNQMYKYDVVICHLNRTRNHVNKLIREQFSYDKQSVYPLKGEKIICLKNNYNFKVTYKGIEVYLINGLIGIVLEDSEIDKQTGKLRIKFTPDFMYGDIEYQDEYFEVLCHPEYFEVLYYPNIKLPLPFKNPFSNTDETIDMDKDDDEDDDTAFITYGYSLTCTKSQGSEFDTVLVLDDYIGPRNKYFNFLYTAITRAKKAVTYASYK